MHGSYEELSEEEKIDKMKNIPDYSRGKTEIVAWMVGNCVAQLRMAFVQNLKKYIMVALRLHFTHNVASARRV